MLHNDATTSSSENKLVTVFGPMPFMSHKVTSSTKILEVTPKHEKLVT